MEINFFSHFWEKKKKGLCLGSTSENWSFCHCHNVTIKYDLEHMETIHKEETKFYILVQKGTPVEK